MDTATRAIEISSSVYIGITIVIAAVISIAVSIWVIVLSVRIVIHNATRKNGRCIEHMPRTVDISPVKRTDIPYTVIVIPKIVVKDPHSANTHDAPVGITYFYITCLDNTAIVVVIDRYILYLYHSSVIVVLNISVVVVASIIGYIHIGRVYIYIHSSLIAYVDEIELTIGKY